MKQETDITVMEPGKIINKGWGVPISDLDELSPVECEPLIGELFAYHVPEEDFNHHIKVETVKVLYFRKGKKCSFHTHCDKTEVFICSVGLIRVEYILRNADRHEVCLTPGCRVFIPRGTPHRITGLSDLNVLVEVSTLDDPNDSYRIERGD